MKKLALSVLILASGAAVMAAHAADGTIRFTGSISDQTCTVASGSQNMNVALGKVARTALNGSAGLQAAPTRFTLSLTGCPDTVAGANVKFDGRADSVNQRLLALDTGTGVATGVGIQIADRNGTEIPLHTASPDYPLAAGANSLDFVARYVSTGTTVTTGTANGTSQFTIIYR